MFNKGIVIAGGEGSRLWPLTKSISKQLLPIYDKPMIYYPLSLLMLAGVRNICVLVKEDQLHNYQKLLGTGEQFGVQFTYRTQNESNGIAGALANCSDFIDHDPVMVILGDNLFYGYGLVDLMKEAKSHRHCSIFAVHKQNPKEFGVAKFNSENVLLEVVEKPEKPPSTKAVVGLYFFNSSLSSALKKMIKSERGEFEITSIINYLIEKDEVQLIDLGRGVAWFDSGTPQRLLEASNFVKAVELGSGLKIACLEEIALKNGWITERKVISEKCDYVNYYVEVDVNK